MPATSDSSLRVYFTESERTLVRKIAHEKHCSESFVIRMLIHTYLPEEYREVVATLSDPPSSVR